MAKASLPSLRAPYDTDPDYNNLRISSPQRSRSFQRQSQSDQPLSRGPSRLDLLEERLAAQERNTQGLIERAFKIKEDVIDSLNFTHGTWQEEKHARKMLQEHIQTITAIVNKLNVDISGVEDQLRGRDAAAVGTNNAVKNLEVHHVSSLTDMRGRIVRCDTSIQKLSTDIRGCFDSVKQVAQQHQDGQGKVMDRIHSLESKIVSLTNQLDRYNSEQKMKIQHLEGDTSQQMAIIDNKSKTTIEDLKNNFQAFQESVKVEQEKLEGNLRVALEKSEQNNNALVERLEQKIDETRYVVDGRIQKMEDSLEDEKQRISGIQNHIENKVLAKLDASIRQQQDDISKVKRECRDGFATVHESITNMKTVNEGKRKLLEDQLRKEISQIRKMVVLV